MSGLNTVFKLGYEISPIILTGGVATNIPGGMLPIVAITEAANFVTGLLSGGTDADLDDFFAHFKPLPGSTLAENQIGHYTFANQSVAANAIIAQPLRIALQMVCPVKLAGGYIAKLATFSALQAVLAQHSASGGLYTIATPAFIYTNCILVSLKDASSGDTKQTQYAYVWEFEQPLVTLAAAAQAQNSLMQKIGNGLPTDGSTSGPGATLGNAASGAAPSIVPAAQPLAGASSSAPYMLGGTPTP